MIKIRAEKLPFMPGVSIVMLSQGNPVTGFTVNEEARAGDAVTQWSLEPSNAQELMDDLWAAGIRPSEGTGSAGSLKATEYHLDDMRNIALTLLEETRPLRIREPHVIDTSHRGSK